MSRAAQPPAESLPSRFLVADARANGLPRRRLRASDLDSTMWGLRSTTALVNLGQRCQLLRLRMPPSAFVCHVTAAILHGIPVPWQRKQEHAIHVGVAGNARAPHAGGLIGHRLSVHVDDVEDVAGIRRTTAIRTWCDLAEELDLLDLVAAGDYLLYWRAPRATLQQLVDAVASRVSRRGIRVLRRALGLLNDRSESPPESLLRTLLVLAGFDPPLVNHAVSGAFGEFVARTDLILQKERVVLEYQGDHHRTTKGQWRADMTRRSRLEALGWRVMELNADDLKNPVELLARIRAVIALG
jgi:hypothetical protein